ncbi:MAG: SDR family oxidoreductase [Oceanobacter sp.]
MARILVVGAGDIGEGFARKMSEGGHQVWCLRRSEQSLEDHSADNSVHWIQADVTEPESLGQLPDNLDIVLYSVASPDFSQASYQAYYVDGLKNMLAALQGQPIKRCMFVSSTSVYHQMDGEWVDEQTIAEPHAFAGKEHLNAEKALLDNDIAGTVVRFSGIYGLGRNRLIQQAKRGGHCDPEPPVWTNRIHRDDCIGVLALLTEKALAGEALDDLYLASDDEPASMYDVLEWIKDRIGDVEPDHDLPEVTRRANRRCSNQRLKALGYEFKYPGFRDGYDEILTEMGYD